MAAVLVHVLRVQHGHGLEVDGRVVGDLEGHVGGPVASEDVEGFRKYVVVDQTYDKEKCLIERSLSVNYNILILK